MKKTGIVLMLIACIMLSGCKDNSSPEQMGEEQIKRKLQIGMSFDSFVIERWQRDRDIFVSTAKELGAEVNVQNANGIVEEQIAQIEYFIEKQMDVIVIICIESEGLQDVVEKAQRAGIKVIAYDRMIKSSNVDLYISFDNEMVGALMAQTLVDAGLPNKKVLMVCGSAADNNVPEVERGFLKVMEVNGVEVLGKYYADGWKSELAYQYIYDNPELLEQVDGIMCGNDNLATSVVRALSEKRLAGVIKVVGQDADLEACQRIVEGTQVMTVYKPVEKLAQNAAEYAIKLAKGNSLPDIPKVEDGVNLVPGIVLDPIPVTIKNIDKEIINSGYHLREDVYLNVPQK